MARIVEDSYLKALCDWIIGCDEHYEMDKSRVLAEIKEDLENMQEVVRCKDCKHSKQTQWYSAMLQCCHKSHGRSQVPYEVPKEHFCSYGERREGE